MKRILTMVAAALLSSCASQKFETPLENLDPFINYQQASVYRLLNSPRELEGVRLRTYGIVRFTGFDSNAYLYANSKDLSDDFPLNKIELRFSEELQARQWFDQLTKEKMILSGWIVGIYKSNSGANQGILLDDISELDISTLKK